MTNDELKPNDEGRNASQIQWRPFVIGASSFFRHSTFVLRHFLD